MIMKTEDSEEMFGRLRILSKIAYLHEQCKSWDRARAAYFAIISSIEEGESLWTSSFGHYDIMCPPVTITETKHDKLDKGSSSATGRGKQVKPKDYYCHEYQKGECTLQAPHRSWFRNAFEMVEHYCNPCYKQKLGKLSHMPYTEDCSSKK